MNKNKELLPFCECGCGQRVSKKGNKFINGHNPRSEKSKRDQSKKLKLKNPMNNPKSRKKISDKNRNKEIDIWIKENTNKHLCNCGCNEYIIIKRQYYSMGIPRFIYGHWIRTNNPMKNPDTIKKVSDKNRNKEIDIWIEENTNKHLCTCGCNKYITIKRHHYSVGIPKYVTGHNAKKKEIDIWIKENTNKHFCDCGCGEVIKIIRNHYNVGIPKYLEGHNACTKEARKKMRERSIGRIVTDDQKKKISATLQGVTYDDWEGFTKNLLYCPKFNEECKESNREKYSRKCFLCGLPEEENISSKGKQQKLSVHHIDMDKMQGCDNIRWKLVPLCMKCHAITHNELWKVRITWLLKNIWI
jgi:CDGSH-type Zn-finger protein